MTIKEKLQDCGQKNRYTKQVLASAINSSQLTMNEQPAYIPTYRGTPHIHKILKD